MQTKSKFRK